MTTDIKEKFNGLVQKRAEEGHVPREKAADDLKRDIVEENVEPGFFESVASVIKGTAAAVGATVQDACAVM